jgi:hypothetical protein
VWLVLSYMDKRFISDLSLWKDTFKSWRIICVKIKEICCKDWNYFLSSLKFLFLFYQENEEIYTAVIDILLW